MKNFIVYHGQGLTSIDFQQLIDAKDDFLIFNNFLSTSEVKQIAMDFVEITFKNEDNASVLFIMATEQSLWIISMRLFHTII